MNAGRMNHQVVVHVPTETMSTLGEPVAVYSTGATVWAAIHPVTGREAFLSEQWLTKVDTLITTRYYPTNNSTSMQAMTPKCLLTHTTNGATVEYFVEWIDDPDERHVMYNFYCFRVQP